jgi:hypothetical protein
MSDTPPLIFRPRHDQRLLRPAHFDSDNYFLLGPPTMRGAIVFSGSSHPGLVDGICDRLGSRRGDASLGKFANGETSVSIRESTFFFYMQSATCSALSLRRKWNWAAGKLVRSFGRGTRHHHALTHTDWEANRADAVQTLRSVTRTSLSCRAGARSMPYHLSS